MLAGCRIAARLVTAQTVANAIINCQLTTAVLVPAVLVIGDLVRPTRLVPKGGGSSGGHGPIVLTFVTVVCREAVFRPNLAMRGRFRYGLPPVGGRHAVLIAPQLLVMYWGRMQRAEPLAARCCSALLLSGMSLL